MKRHTIPWIQALTGAETVESLGTIQTLWSGYGEIVRARLHPSTPERVVIKHVQLPDRSRHPRGWDTDRSHLRKLRSYEVESSWYREWAGRCDAFCRVPRCLGLDAREGEFLMILEDLDGAGFSVRKTSVGAPGMKACLRWLAHFHARFLGEVPTGLWETGTYWHLATRPDEWEVLDDLPLKSKAQAIDQRLQASPFQTLVHGDAKLANFCFMPGEDHVAAVDFQYVGGGCGMKDVAYFIGSCLEDDDCERWAPALLDAYFEFLKTALESEGKAALAADVEADWRCLYPVAWTDFHRFLKGWSPGHWKIHGYSERLAASVVAEMDAEGCEV